MNSKEQTTITIDEMKMMDYVLPILYVVPKQDVIELDTSDYSVIDIPLTRACGAV